MQRADEIKRRKSRNCLTVFAGLLTEWAILLTLSSDTSVWELFLRNCRCTTDIRMSLDTRPQQLCTQNRGQCDVNSISPRMRGRRVSRSGGSRVGLRLGNEIILADAPGMDGEPNKLDGIRGSEGAGNALELCATRMTYYMSPALQESHQSKDV